MTVTPRRLTASRLAGIRELDLAFNDWTDTHDIHDGGGVQPPSAGPHVAALQESLLAMGYELPEHGVDGVYGRETTAAVTQLQIDAGHPRAPGHEWEHVLGISGPNTLAHFDMFDPGGTVGDSSGVVTGIRAAAVSFSESADNPRAGLDITESPSVLVVGTRTRRRVHVERVPAVADVAFVPADPTIVTVAPIADGIVVGGERAGMTIIEAVSGGEVVAELAVTVKDVREEVVNFFLVCDSNNPRAATVRNLEQARLLTLRLNRVWRRQANVRFKLAQVREVVLNLGGLLGGEPDISQSTAIPGEFNIFCVAAQDDDARDPIGGLPDEECGLRNPTVFVLSDNACPDGMAAIHAAGHYLGFRTHLETGAMSSCEEGQDRERVSSGLADIVNP